MYRYSTQAKCVEAWLILHGLSALRLQISWEVSVVLQVDKSIAREKKYKNIWHNKSELLGLPYYKIYRYIIFKMGLKETILLILLIFLYSCTERLNLFTEIILSSQLRVKDFFRKSKFIPVIFFYTSCQVCKNRNVFTPCRKSRWNVYNRCA